MQTVFLIEQVRRKMNENQWRSNDSDAIILEIRYIQEIIGP